MIHGTDTLAYTSAMLSFMLQNISIPVVVTGSQLSIANRLQMRWKTVGVESIWQPADIREFLLHSTVR